jgi:organic hydroperoxide reductase OsmC/OhrA
LSKLEVYLEADIGNTAAWGAGGAERKPEQMGFQAIRVKVDIEGDADKATLEEIVQHANYFSPVANTMRNPVADFQISTMYLFKSFFNTIKASHSQLDRLCKITT